MNLAGRFNVPYGAPKSDVVIPTLDELLNAGGEATWLAGPLTKGANLCHGTGGNGYAFLKLYRRTREKKWLERARAFAMHAIAQTEADVRQYSQSRYSLWTGDLGLAIYLWDCIHGSAEFPSDRPGRLACASSTTAPPGASWRRSLPHPDLSRRIHV